MTVEQRRRRKARFAMVARVGKDLQQLGLSPSDDVDHEASRAHLAGLGWCQATYAPEEAWPPGAELCAVVQWFPDKAYRRDSRTGKLPSLAGEHWKRRVAATVRELESIGYLVAVSGPPRAPHLHPGEELLVWRPREGKSNTWPPFGAWDGLEPARPNFKTGPNAYPYPERNPATALGAALGKLRAGTAEDGRAYVTTAGAALWPPYAEYCARVLWEPAEQFRCLPDGTLPDGAVEHWQDGVERVRCRLQGAGYHVRTAERPTSPVQDEEAGLLVWVSKVRAFSYGDGG
ncbi:hypothetical protein [Streptomyces sp. NPDC058861]|uniref:hypothetical protein n=1 Tax=Streptomyces sp. NPDC058861 TaxID=3346653 RepID=UPI0036B3235A